MVQSSSMPLPWKKSKVGRISRLVADLRSPPKHGGSLVVETGFPTSLIDLIVKNRDRLKNKKKKKKKKKNDEASEEWEPVSNHFSLPDSFDSSSYSLSSSPSVGPLSYLDSASSSPSADPVVSAHEIDNSSQPRIGKEISPLVTNVVGDVVSRGVVRCGGAFMISVKVLFMVILAFATKRLAVGITISTFLLLFLEFVTSRVFCFLKSCPDGRKKLNSFIEWPLFFVRRRRGLITENVSTLSETYESLIDEGEIVKIDFDSLSSERRWGICLTEDNRSCSEEIQLNTIARRWSSEKDINLNERRIRSESSSHLRDGRLIIGSNKIDQAHLKEIQRVKLDSEPRGRSWGTDSRKNGKARNLEIQPVDAGLDFGATRRSQNKEIQHVEPESNLSSRRKRWGIASSSKRGKNSKEDEKIVESAELRNEKTNNAKIKSKKLLKKLFPKKFRGSKKSDNQENQRDLSSEVSVCLDEETTATREGRKQREGNCEQAEPEDEELSGETEEGENEVNSDDVSQVDSNADLVEGNGRRTACNFGYIIMVLIVLAGLVQGRVMAVLLTMVWFLLVKSIQAVKRMLKIT
ncbi:hypothetical protein NE237_025096 [Protea cynaroides]|uniref:Ethylene-responsive nuclear protein n=1 Tax=Protea cynaroides TaxID=273540 RepID=A0A9Q0H4K9_9MAGN|nr:hypothetical protein NE237_025096 [Protea cynaroides]